MKRASLFGCLVLSLWVLGCGQPRNSVLTINTIEISKQEFEDAYQRSRYAYMGQEGKKLFLDSYINMKLILKEAEELGLDKDQEFLRDIQFFWEQSLLKEAIAARTNELASQVRVGDSEVQKYYEEHKSEFGNKPLSEVYDQVRWLLLKIKQSEAVAQWTNGLRSQADIKVDWAALGLNP